MKKLIIYIVLSFLLLSCGKEDKQEKDLNQSISKISPIYKGEFIGFNKNLPVFFSKDSNTLFSVSLNKEVEILDKYFNDSITPLFINDNGIIFMENRNDKFYLRMNTYIDSSIKYIPINNPACAVTATTNLDTLILSEDCNNEVLKLLVPSLDKIVTLPYRGMIPVIVTDYFYFISEIDPSEEGGYGGSSVYKVSLKNIEKKELVVEKIYLDFYVSTNGRYIASDFDKDHEVQSGVYDTLDKKITFFEKDQNLNMAYFLEQENAFVFYSPLNVLNNFVYKINQ